MVYFLVIGETDDASSGCLVDKPKRNLTVNRLIFHALLWEALLFGFVPGMEAQSSPSGITLAECFKKAVQVSETLAIDDETIRQLEAQYKQGVGAILPHLSWTKKQLYRDDPGGGSSSFDAQRTSQHESYFQLTQPLFHGFKEFRAIAAVKAMTMEARRQRQQAELDLLKDLATIYFTSFDLQEELGILKSQRGLTQERLDELERRVQLGKSRDSEVLSAQVDLASLDAQIEETNRSHANARQILQFLTEVKPEVPLLDTLPETTSITLEEALGQLSKRPSVLAAEDAQRAAQHRLAYAKGGYLPSLDLTGDYWTEREGSLSEVRWDAMFTLYVPIFEGLSTQGQVQEARSQAIATELAASRARRLGRQEIQNAHQDLRNSLSQVQFFERAVTLAERNYTVQQREYRLGLINNLEVLRTLTQLEDLRIKRQRARAVAKSNAVNLRVAMGQGL